MATDATPPPTHDAYQAALDLYIDGELPFEQHADLFAHLATCQECQQVLDSVMRFRRYSRQERITVAPAIDAEFFEKLAHAKKQQDRVDRRQDREPLWSSRRSVPVGAAAMLGVLLFIVGLINPLPSSGETDAALLGLVRGEPEVIEFKDEEQMRNRTIYVFYPGLEVEDEDESGLNEPL
ncbi:MAG: zf-HC2 domain-containing protein [Bacteroidota bacterium]